jgi:hypothetical protein
LEFGLPLTSARSLATDAAMHGLADERSTVFDEHVRKPIGDTTAAHGEAADQWWWRPGSVAGRDAAGVAPLPARPAGAPKNIERRATSVRRARRHGRGA